MADQNTRTITAHNLLHAFLDLRRLAPDTGDWSSERLASNPPRLFRLQQLIALFRAFEIDWDPVSFVEGKFIQPKSTRYAALLGTMASAMPEAGRPGFRVDSRHLPVQKMAARYATFS